MKTQSTFLFLAALVTWSASAWSQQKLVENFISNPGTRGELCALLTNGKVRLELQLTAKQTDLVAELMQKRTESTQGLPINPNSIRVYFQRWGEVDKEVKAILSPSQYKRLMQLFNQIEIAEFPTSFGMLSDFAAFHLKLADRQREVIRPHRAEFEKRYVGRLAEMRVTLAGIDDKWKKEIFGKLSVQQQAAYVALFGKELPLEGIVHSRVLAALNRVNECTDREAALKDANRRAELMTGRVRDETTNPFSPPRPGELHGIVTSESVAVDLALTPQQRQQLFDLLQNQSQKIQTIYSDPKSKENQDAISASKERMRAYIVESDKRITEVLSNEQFDRLLQIMVQHRSTSYLDSFRVLSPWADDVLHLTDNQKDQVAEWSVDYQIEFIDELFATMRDLNAIQADARAKIMAELTDKQRGLHKEVFGEAFDFGEQSDYGTSILTRGVLASFTGGPMTTWQ